MELTGFTPLPGWILGFVASMLLFIVLKKWGNVVTPEGNRIADLALDLSVMLTFATAIASLNATNLVGAITAVINDWVASWGTGWAPALIIALIVVALGWLYQASEKTSQLILFGVFVQVWAASDQRVLDVMQWWVSHTVMQVWNLVMRLLGLI